MCPGLDVANSAPPREEELEEALQVLSLTYHGWKGSQAAGEGGWSGLAFLELLKDILQACGLQEAPLLSLEGGPGALSRLDEAIILIQ